MKSDIGNIHSGCEWHAKGLDRAIEVLVIERVFVVVNTGRRVGHFVTHKPDTIVARVGFNLTHRGSRPCPSHDSRFHPDRVRGRRKRKTRGAADVELAIRHIVIHVALPGVRLTPGVFVRGKVCSFGKISGALVERCVQVVDLHADAVRHAVMAVAGVVVSGGWEGTGESIDPGARTKSALTPIQTGNIGIGTARA